VGVLPEPVTVTEAVTETPKPIELPGLRVGTGTVGAAALTVCILTNAHIDNKSRHITKRIFSFLISFPLNFPANLLNFLSCLVAQSTSLTTSGFASYKFPM
jgi:hypothetical protein